MYKKPFFSIITATYNSGLTLRKTLDSIVNLKFKDFEYIIIDGKSVDNTIEIILEFEEVFSRKGIQFKWISENDNGIYDAWNKGIKLASGKWISFLGSDDYYMENALNLYYEAIILNEGSNYISTKVDLIDTNNNKIKSIGSKFNKKTFLRYMNVAHVGSFHKKVLFEDNKFSLKYKVCADYDFFLRNIDAIEPIYIDKVTAKMLEGGVSNNVNKALRESLMVKLKNNKRNKFLCYFDFYYFHFKHFLYRNYRNILKS